MSTPPVSRMPPEITEKAKSSHETKETRGIVQDSGATATVSPPLVVEVGSAVSAVAAARVRHRRLYCPIEAVGGFTKRASLKKEIGRPSLFALKTDAGGSAGWGTTRLQSQNALSARVDARPIKRLASCIGDLAMEAEGLARGSYKYQLGHKRICYRKIGGDQRARSSSRNPARATLRSLSRQRRGVRWKKKKEGKSRGDANC
ncbi:hypothetical protein EVAR_85978_1 [Eumeta japonica]|uniref:Uncharacterized protein n=1 Tax=Eumeta variegata TaxID=151549 RepID=A0A4C1UKH5_EUMVA|nr:hypothetical protein EVAR_85978_1 [Eumeta japonica]